jgi:hypothetical protein
LRDSGTREDIEEETRVETRQSSCIYEMASDYGVENCGRYVSPLSSDRGYDSVQYGSMLNPFLSK